MKREYEEAFVEVDEILKLMPIELLSKIPVQFRNVITENKATDYKADIKEPIEEQKLKKETTIILGLIYRDFLASPEEKERLQLKDAEELRKVEEELQKQYDIIEVFEKRIAQINKEENNTETTDLMLYEEPSFLKKIFSLIKGLFKKNKF